MKTAVVLSGGGAKGAYQLGCWKALRKLHIKYQIVTGTSVGALNGVLMVQNSYYTASKIWKNITYKDVCGQEFQNNITSTNDIDVYKQYIKSFFSDGGMDGVALEHLFGKYISNWRFRLSPVDYGIITVNLSTHTPVELTKKNMHNNLRDYVLASASCYPAFKTKTINNQNYVDGGYYDNLPINLAIKMGADRVIAIDLRAPGFKKLVTDKNIEVIRIYPRNKIGSFLIFDKKLANRAIKFGYNDTMKTFGKLDGNKFTFRKNDLFKNYNKYRNSIIKTTSLLASDDDLILNAIIKFNDVNTILKKNNFSKLHNDIIEYLGKAFNMDESQIYNINSFNDELLYNFEQIGCINRLSEKIMLDSKLVMAYIYNLITSDKPNIRKICRTMVVFKKEFMGALYIMALEKN